MDRTSPDELRDYLDGRLSDFEQRRVEGLIRNDLEIARAFTLIRDGAELIRARLEMTTEIPAEWMTIISRWKRVERG